MTELKREARQPLIYLRKSKLADADNDLQAHERRAILKMQERGEENPLIIAEPEGNRSGYSENRRPGYQQVQQLIEANKVSTLFINDRARIWRNAMEYIQFLMFCAKHKTEIVPSIEAPIGDISDPNQQLLEFIQGWQNEQYRNRVSNSQRATKQDFREMGLPVGNRGRFGLDLVGSMFERRHQPNADFPNLVFLIELYAEGTYSRRRLALAYNASGRKGRNKQGNEVPLSLDAVAFILDNLEGYKPFLAPTLYARALAVRKTRSITRSSRRVVKYTPTLLQGVLFCADCGGKYYSGLVKQPPYKEQMYYYHNDRITCHPDPRWVVAWRIDNAFKAEMHVIQERLEQNRNIIIADMIYSPSLARPDVHAERAKLEAQLDEFIIMRSRKEIDSAQLQKHTNAIKTLLDELPLENEIADEGMDEVEANAFVDDILARLRDNITNQTVRELVKAVHVKGRGITGVDWAFSTR